jgi:hypothetical protein
MLHASLNTKQEQSQRNGGEKWAAATKDNSFSYDEEKNMLAW